MRRRGSGSTPVRAAIHPRRCRRPFGRLRAGSGAQGHLPLDGFRRPLGRFPRPIDTGQRSKCAMGCYRKPRIPREQIGGALATSRDLSRLEVLFGCRAFDVRPNARLQIFDTHRVLVRCPLAVRSYAGGSRAYRNAWTILKSAYTETTPCEIR